MKEKKYSNNGWEVIVKLESLTPDTRINMNEVRRLFKKDIFNWNNFYIDDIIYLETLTDDSYKNLYVSDINKDSKIVVLKIVE